MQGRAKARAIATAHLKGMSPYIRTKFRMRGVVM